MLIQVAGGTSMLPYFGERMRHELAAIMEEEVLKYVSPYTSPSPSPSTPSSSLQGLLTRMCAQGVDHASSLLHPPLSSPYSSLTPPSRMYACTGCRPSSPSLLPPLPPPPPPTPTHPPKTPPYTHASTGCRSRAAGGNRFTTEARGMDRRQHVCTHWKKKTNRERKIARERE
jgi:hypothetical protein